MIQRNVVIIGAGPAGIAAAIELLRSGVEPLLLDSGTPGGLLWNAHRVENYPGFPSGLSGPRLVRRFLRQLQKTGGAVVEDRATALSVEDDFVLNTATGLYKAKIVIIASGTRPCPVDSFDIPSDCWDLVYRDVWPLRGGNGRRIAIVGGGDAAFDYAVNLSRRNHVVIFNRSDTTRCLPLLKNLVKNSPNITYAERCQLLSVRRYGSKLHLTISEQEGTSEQTFDILVIAIGREPELSFIDLDVLKRCEELQQIGKLHLIGDVQNGIYRQTAIAVGDGIRAAMKVSAKLGEGNHEDC
ncbi:NAD(P)/FAD-dependent oxidoreductase [Candidatus Bipolaricaulota bacterium]